MPSNVKTSATEVIRIRPNGAQMLSVARTDDLGISGTPRKSEPLGASASAAYGIPKFNAASRTAAVQLNQSSKSWWPKPLASEPNEWLVCARRTLTRPEHG